MKNLIYTFCFFSVALFFSCETINERKNLYYDVDSLVHEQTMLLAEAKATLGKKAEIDGEVEENSFTPKDTTAWANELDIFSELKVINNSINAGKYGVEKGVKDPSSNLTIHSFTAKDKETLPVVYLKVFYLDTPSRLRRIEALYREENSLLKGSRHLILEFQEIHNKIVLVSYSIEGSQKMFLGDSVKFSIKGTITLP